MEENLDTDQLNSKEDSEALECGEQMLDEGKELPDQEPEANQSQASSSVDEDGKDSPLKSKNKKGVAQSQKEFDSFVESLGNEGDFDQKLKLAIDKMEHYLSQGGIPQFKYFWELRKLALDYFKENISPAARAVLWPKYSELSKEARRLKEMFDEQSAFAVEQINMAIDALEAELANFEECILKHEDIDFQFQSNFLEEKLSNYNDQQKRLNLLNAHAARVNTLRKELIKVDMRVKQKNKFFQRLSEAGDKVFPLRKELIKSLSDQFIQDVDRFISTYFSDGEAHDSVFFLREEIKSLQGIAKVLTLNTHSFTSTRLRLSELWDRLKSVDKERRKERAERKEVFKKNHDEIHRMIVQFSEKFQNENLSVNASHKILDEVQKNMRELKLGRDEVKYLKDELNNARKLIKDKLREEERIQQEEEAEKLRIKKDKFDEIKSEIDAFTAKTSELSIEEIETKRDQLLKDIADFKELSTRERNDLERPLRSLNDLLNLKREEALLNLSEDDQETLKNLREVLRQRKKRREEIYAPLKALRKTADSSFGLDFEKAMLYREQISVEEERLKVADEGIFEMEEKITEITKKIK